MCIAIGCNGMVDVQLVFDKVLVDGMDRVQRSFLTWDPNIVSSSFLGFGPREV
jgi:hypothetical protein